MKENNERRTWSRLTTLFPVIVESSMYGFTNCIARNISGGGIFLEAEELLPLGTAISVFFAPPTGGCNITAKGVVKNHYYLNYNGADGPRAVMGMGVKFTQFEGDGLFELKQSLLESLPLQ